MKIISEISLSNFEFWSGAEDRAKNCTIEDLDAIEEILEEGYPEGIEDGELNNLFWFDFDTVARWLGYEDEADFDRKRDPDYLDDDDLEDYVEDWFKEFMADLKKDHSWEDIITVYEYLFDGDEEVAEEEYREKTGDPHEFTEVKYAKTAYDIIIREIPENDLMELLFEDDNGECETDGLIPSKEDFRDEMMDKRKNLRNNE